MAAAVIGSQNEPLQIQPSFANQLLAQSKCASLLSFVFYMLLSQQIVFN